MRIIDFCPPPCVMFKLNYKYKIFKKRWVFMNKKAFSILILLCLSLQMNMIFSAQGWWDWLRSKWEKSSVATAIIEKAKAKAFAKGRKFAIKYSGMKPNQIMDILDLFWAFTEDIQSIISWYKTGSIDQDEAIETIKNDLFIIVNNQLLYPTRSSKINALLKKDEFLQYIDDQDNLLQDACNKLIEEIVALNYSESKKETDKAIDARLATLKAIIVRGQSITEQIKLLETTIDQKQHFDIPEMQAYLSLYFRLKNKQNVEGKLTKEEKELQQPWNIETSKIEKRIVSEPEVD